VEWLDSNFSNLQNNKIYIIYIKCTQYQEEVKECQSQERRVLREPVEHERVEQVSEVEKITSSSDYFKVFDLLKIRENI
jgi:uncharacterized cysteine cluster protein YcgN (CxxCxxCC family)